MKKQILAVAAVAFAAGSIFFTSCKKEDTTAPVITITGGNTMSQSLPSVAGNGTFTAPAATATDDEDGDLTSSITVDASAVNANSKGSYTVTYSVSDAAGNTASATLTVDIVNDAEYLAGTYSVVDSVYLVTPAQSGLPWVSSYTDAITTDNATNNKFWVSKFGNYVNGLVYFSHNNGQVSVATQNVTCGNPSAVRTFNANAVTVNSSPYRFQLYYVESVQASSTTASSGGRYIHQ